MPSSSVAREARPGARGGLRARRAARCCDHQLGLASLQALWPPAAWQFQAGLWGHLAWRHRRVLLPPARGLQPPGTPQVLPAPCAGLSAQLDGHLLPRPQNNKSLPVCPRLPLGKALSSAELSWPHLQAFRQLPTDNPLDRGKEAQLCFVQEFRHHGETKSLQGNRGLYLQRLKACTRNVTPFN